MAGGGKGGGAKAPEPPDPYETSMAQYLANVATAREQQKMNATDINTPYGSVVNQDLGDGRWQQNVVLSPEQQFLLDQQSALSANMNAQAGQTLGNLGTGQYQDAVYNQYAARLDPQWEQAGGALATKLANQGIKPGSSAYDTEMRNFQMGKTDAYGQATNQSVLTGLSARNQLVNEALALSGRGQPQNVAAPGLPSTGLQAPDYQGAAQAQYQGQLANYNAQQQQSSGMLGGLFSLGSAALGGWASAGFPSDRRVKTGIRRVGTTDGGLPIYTFRYVWGGPMQMGVMAQDVEQVTPSAVSERNGIKLVDYAQVA